jgi:hypothetical protein
MKHLALLLLVALTGCGGGGSSAVPATQVAVASPTTAPGVTPTIPPATPGTPAPSPAAALRAVGAAGGGLATSSGQRSTLATVPNSIPKIIISFSANANWGGIAGNVFLWVYSTVTGQTVPTTGLTLTLDPALRISGLPLQDTIGRFGLSNDWTTLMNPPTKTGVLSMTATFNDGTTGTIPVYSYDTWLVGCQSGNPPADLYQNGAPVPSTVGSEDVSIDCVGRNLVFAKGAALASSPVADSAGNVLSTVASVLKTGTVPTTSTTFSISSLANGQVYVARTRDGGFAKFQLSNIDPTSGILGGQALYSASGTFAF